MNFDRMAETRGTVDMVLKCKVCDKSFDVTAYVTNGSVDPDAYRCPKCDAEMEEE
jgi:hypothetical protein